MILQTRYDGDRKSTDVTARPRESDVAEAVRSMDWNRFAFVTLFKDDDNWLEGSGCLEPDFGLSMMLSVDGIQFVTETAPPTPDSMLGVFNAYLNDDQELLFALIYDAKGRGLTSDDVANLRREEVAAQRQRMMRKAVSQAAELFSNGDYAGCIQKLAPFESLLEPMDAKRLSIARKKYGDSAEQL